MTDRLRGVYVAFEQDIREDDAEPLLAAIRMLRGVMAVMPDVVNPMDYVATERARRELWSKLRKVIEEQP